MPNSDPQKPWKTGVWNTLECFAPGCRNLNKKAKAAEEKLAAAARHLQKKREVFWNAEKDPMGKHGKIFGMGSGNAAGYG